MASTRRSKRNGSQITRAIAYARFSSNNQREESIDAQLRAINEYCEDNGVNLIETFKDEAQSAKTDNRDNFQVMITEVLKGKHDIDAIIVHKFNRFARNKYDSVIYKKRLKEMGIKVISVTQKIDDSPEGQMLEGFLEIIDQYYSENLALEVRKGMRENALAGKTTGGGRVLGLSVDDNGFYYPNEQAPIVKRIFAEFVSGVPKTKICERLNYDGYRNQYGRKFNTRTLDGILQNEKYIGTYVYNITHSETIRLEGVIQDPIIDKDLWYQAQEKKKDNNKPRYSKKARYYFMSGKLKCGVCGSTYCGSGSKKSGRGGKINAYYRCTGKTKYKNGCTNSAMNKEYYESIVLDKLVTTILTDEFIKTVSLDVFDKIEAEKKEPQISTEKLKKQLAAIREKQSKLTDLYLDGRLDKEMLDDRNENLLEEKKGIERQLSRNEVLTETNAISISDIETFIREYKEHLRNSAESETEFASLLFHTFVEEITVYENTLEIKIKADFSSAFGCANSTVGRAITTVAPAQMQLSLSRRNVVNNK